MASTDLALLERNQVSVLMPASRKPPLAESMGLKVLPYIDGAGLACGDVSCEKFLERVEEVSQYLFEGQGVLVCCANGAHRSATELTVMVMRLTGWGAQKAAGYVASLREHSGFAQHCATVVPSHPPNKADGFPGREIGTKIASPW